MESILSSALDSVNWITAALALAVCLAFYFYIQWSNMPPGPIGLPYLGYYPFLRQDYHLHLHELTQKYGSVFCFRCTGQLFLYLGSLQEYKEVAVAKAEHFNAMSSNFTLGRDIFKDGIAFEAGETWKTLRRFFAQQLKNFSVGKHEDTMADFLKKTIDDLRKKGGDNLEALTYFTDICSKVIHDLLFRGTKVSDEDIKIINEAYSSMTEVLVGKRLLLSGPLLKYVLLRLKPGLRNYRHCRDSIHSILSKFMRDHEESFDKENIRDLVDAYINERKIMEEKEDPKAKLFSDKALLSTLLQFVGDGGSSVGFFVALALEMFSRYPEVQKNIQREINDAIGSSRLPSIHDKSSMPYTNAAIYECMRTCDFFPALTLFKCSQETTVSGCRVPKGTIMLINFWAVLHDRDVYENPEKFDPSRFLPNEENKPKSDLPVLFGIGKRSCIGESLVLAESFLFITAILQNFNLLPVQEDKPEDSTNKKEAQGFNIRFRAIPRTV